MFIETEGRITAAYIFYSWTKNNSNNRHTSMKYELLEFAKLRAIPACVPKWYTFEHACVAAWYTCQRVCAPTCQKRANFSFLHANVPYGVPLFYLDVPTCQMVCQFFKHFCDQVLRMLSYKRLYILLDILVIHIICIFIVNKNCIILYPYTSSCNIKEKCVEFFFFYRFSFLLFS